MKTSLSAVYIINSNKLISVKFIKLINEISPANERIG